MKKKFLMGLDLGSNSVGWAVTDENNKLIRKNGKCLWGVRLFEEADDCKERRSFRNGRRRLARRRRRIQLLQMLFAEEIGKIDKNFFIRLNESQLQQNDKSLKNRSLIFNDVNYTDKDFFDKYKTIYHLRNELVHSNEKQDIRKIYLALAHIIKYRGNFLSESNDFSIHNLNEIVKSFNNIFNTLKVDLAFNEDDLTNLIEEIKKTRGSLAKKEKLNELINKDKKTYLKNVVIPLILGKNVKITTLFKECDNISEEFNTNQLDGLCFDSEDCEINLDYLRTSFPENEYIALLSDSLKIYDFIQLNIILNGHDYISEAMIDKYNQHKEDLRKLKKYVRENLPEKYYEIFRKIYDKKDSSKINNYVTYIGANQTSDKGFRCAHCSQAEFYTYLKEVLNLKNISEKNTYLEEILQKMEDGNYLPRLNTSRNRLIPYQIHKKELELILNKQKEFYPFLVKEDEYGTIIDKIKSLLTFRIPYYVGPLNTLSNYAWVERTTEHIYPWNFEKVVNLKTSQENFICRMLNKCSYLHSENCLPADSIIFNYYAVLNELNKIYVNGAPITYEDKMSLIKEVYCKKEKVTKKEIEDFFKSRYSNTVKISSSNEKEVDYLQKSLRSLIHFSNILGFEYVKNNIDIVEDIIRDCALFQNKKDLEERLKEKHPDISLEDIKKIKGLTIKNFSRLSKKLLLEIQGISNDGEILQSESILKLLESTNQNFMQIINNEQYGFNNAINEFNKNELDEFKDSKNGILNFIDKQYVSPIMKRPLLQAYKIIEEVEKIIGHPIDEYYIECTRENNKKEKSKTRKEKLLELYKNAIEVSMDAKLLYEKLNRCEDSSLNSDMVYLYFTQLGKDLYTGKEIDFDNLTRNYDIDHIFPQSQVLDDSLDNRVLVAKEINSLKSDKYPIPYESFGSNETDLYNFHNMLKENKLISEKKFNRLTRKVELTDDDIFNFVNRQIVETSQSVKALKDIILAFKVNSEGKQPKVIMSRAQPVARFRQDFELFKSRDANNCHHAHDAFLNIVVGRAINCYFGDGNKERIKYLKDNKLTTNVNKLFEPYTKNKNLKSDIKDLNGNVVWNYETSLKYVKSQIENNHNMLFTTRTYVKSGFFSKVKLKPREQLNEFAWPVKSSTKNTALANLSNPNKYSGYSDLSFGSYSLYKTIDKKGNEKYVIVSIPNLLNKSYNSKDIEDYLERNYNLKNPRLILENLKVNTVFVIGKSKFCITGKTGSRYLIKNLSECFYDKQDIKIIRLIAKLKALWEKDKSFSEKKDGFKVTEKFLEKYKNRIKEDGSFVVVVAKDKEKNKEEILTKQMVKKLICSIQQNLSKDIYSYYSNIKNINDALQLALTNTLNDLDLFKLSYVTLELLKVTKTDRELSDLRLIEMSANSGKLDFPSTLPNCDLKIIAQSITGFYTKVLWEYPHK